MPLSPSTTMARCKQPWTMFLTALLPAVHGLSGGEAVSVELIQAFWNVYSLSVQCPPHQSRRSSTRAAAVSSVCSESLPESTGWMNQTETCRLRAGLTVIVGLEGAKWYGHGTVIQLYARFNVSVSFCSCTIYGHYRLSIAALHYILRHIKSHYPSQT